MTPGGSTRRQLAERIEVVERDLRDIGQQLASGEIEPDTYAELHRRYSDELARSREALSDLEASEAQSEVPTRSRTRMIVGGAVLLVAVVLSVSLVGKLSQDRGDPSLQGVAAGSEFDPESYSDETLEAVIAAYEDDPTVTAQIPFMRFRLAERYFERGEFRLAYPHYSAILETATDADLLGSALTRLAWIVWVGNSELELAIGLLDQAIEIASDDNEALYVKGQILWCGLNDPDAAAALFAEVLESGALDTESRNQVEADLGAVEAGEACFPRPQEGGG